MVALPAAIAALVFLNTLANGFVYDDAIVLSWLDTRRWDVAGFLTQQRGLTYAVHALDRWLWGEAPGGFHFTNVLLHVAATSLATWAAYRAAGSRRAALLCGLFFAVHPVHVEAVANVTNRKDVLAMIFAMAALIAWLRERRSWVRVGIATACIALGLYAKEAAIATLPLALLAADLLLLGRGRDLGARLGTACLHLVPVVALGAAATALVGGDLVRLFDADSIAAKSDGAYRTYGESLATGLSTLPDVLRLLVVPLHLSIDYAPAPQHGFGGAPVILGVSILAGWLALALGLARRAPVASFALLWVGLLHLPTSNVLPLHHILLAERYLYVPSFGLCLLLGHVVDRGLADLAPASLARPLLVAGAAAVLVAGAFRSVVRNADWRDWPALIAAADRDGVDTWRAHKSAGAWAVRDEDYAEAVRRYERAARLRPADPELHFWLAVSLHRSGDLEAAQAEYEATLALQPNHAKAHYHLGLILIQERDLARATEHLRRTALLDPGYSLAHYNLGVALTLLGDLDGAVASLEQTVALEPESAEAHLNLGSVLRTRGDNEQASAALERAASLNPEDPRIFAELGAALAALGRNAEAVDAYRRAGELVTDPAARNSLAARIRELSAGGND